MNRKHIFDSQLCQLDCGVVNLLKIPTIPISFLVFSKTLLLMSQIITHHISIELTPRSGGASTELYELIKIKYRVINIPILPGTISGGIKYETNEIAAKITVDA